MGFSEGRLALKREPPKPLPDGDYRKDVNGVVPGYLGHLPAKASREVMGSSHFGGLDATKHLGPQESPEHDFKPELSMKPGTRKANRSDIDDRDAGFRARPRRPARFKGRGAYSLLSC